MTSSKLEELLPKKTRIKDWQKVEKELGFTVPILAMKNGLILTLFIGLV